MFTLWPEQLKYRLYFKINGRRKLQRFFNKFRGPKIRNSSITNFNEDQS